MRFLILKLMYKTDISIAWTCVAPGSLYRQYFYGVQSLTIIRGLQIKPAGRTSILFQIVRPLSPILRLLSRMLMRKAVCAQQVIWSWTVIYASYQLLFGKICSYRCRKWPVPLVNLIMHIRKLKLFEAWHYLRLAYQSICLPWGYCIHAVDSECNWVNKVLGELEDSVVLLNINFYFSPAVTRS